MDVIHTMMTPEQKWIKAIQKKSSEHAANFPVYVTIGTYTALAIIGVGRLIWRWKKGRWIVMYVERRFWLE
ncbi:hypothetical protein [Paraliobacillus ryukyuensis]|uniref:hypothetical protein n=1 Tax=Paraliobacillus ryukyuensis TaxID=200904 RepID=UPI001181519C|nr:hypothetical protein [Paraliobacillus ryukyuensis]